MAGKLEGKVAIVTGGASKTGAAVCKKFAAEGAKVVVSGFCDDPVDAVVDEIRDNDGTAIGYKGDISTEVKAKECITLATNTWNRLDILVNAAGVFPEQKEMSSYPIEAFYFIIRNNIQTAFMVTRYALPELQQSKGTIVFTGAEAGIYGIAENAPYGGTKGFIHAFSKGLAEEQKKYGITVNCIFNGPADAGWISSTKSRQTRKSEEEKRKTSLSPEQLAEHYLFLVSKEAEHLSGIFYSAKDQLTKELRTIDKRAKTTNRKPAAGTRQQAIKKSALSKTQRSTRNK